MSLDAGGLAQMTCNGFSSAGDLGAPGNGFASRHGSRANNFKSLSVALPPNVNPISENSVDNPTPRTSRSHLLAGLRTQPKTPGVPASAPYNRTQHQPQGLAASQWADNRYSGYGHGVPQTATGSSFNFGNQYAMNAGRQMYSLPEQVLAPPTVYGGQEEEMDPKVLEQLQMTGMFLAQRQQQLQQQLANITAAANQFQGVNIHTNVQRGPFQQSPITPQTPQSFYPQQQTQPRIEIQPGVYLVYNPALQGYSYAFDQSAQQQQLDHSTMSQSQGPLYAAAGSPPIFDLPTSSFRAQVSPPSLQKAPPMSNTRSMTPPKKAPSPPSTLEHVVPLPPPSATAFRRGHKKASSLSINAMSAAADGPKTSSAAVFGSQRSAFPPAPMTGTFGPGAARAGEHPMRQPRGPPPLEELVALPTANYEGSKNFLGRQRRRALHSIMRAGDMRRGVSRSSGGSPVSEGEFSYAMSVEDDDVASAGSRKMSPIGSEMKEKRDSQGSADGYFGLSSGSGSETEEGSAFKQPPTPATPVGMGGERKKMMLGVLTAAEKRKSCIY